MAYSSYEDYSRTGVSSGSATSVTVTGREAMLLAQQMRGGSEDVHQRSETLGLASAYEKEGDTLQSATASISHIRVEKRFDPELGIVIGERTDLTLSTRKRDMIPIREPVPPPAPPQEPPRPAMYGIGLKVADLPPHKILAVNDLKDKAGKSINHMMQVGDVIEAINDVSVNELSIEQLELFVFGPKGSIVDLTMRRTTNNNNQLFHVYCKRHLLIQFALGMSISSKRPYKVLRVDELLDGNNNNVNHLVESGDILEAYNGMSVEDLAVRPVEEIIFGPIDSMVNITFRSAHTGKLYDLAVKRHLPVVSWLRWEEYGGMTQDATSSVVSSDMNQQHEGSSSQAGSGVQGFGSDDVTGEFI